MSSSNAALIEQLQQTRVDNGIIFGLSALVFYEYVITLQDEIEMIWGRRRNAATTLFIVNRYLMVVYNAVGLVIPTTSGILLDVLTVLQFIVFAVFATLRVYAIWNRNIPLAALVCLLNLVPVITNTYDFATDTIQFFVDPIAGPQCFEASKLSDALNFRLSLATRVALIVADGLVLVLTWVVTFGMKARADRLRVNAPFVTCILRDGTLYFASLLVMNVAQIIMKEFPEFSAFPPTILFINSLTPVLISRFLINLRNVDRAVTTHNSDSKHDEMSLTVSTMQFSDGTKASPVGIAGPSMNSSGSIIGPMGWDLEDGLSVSADESWTENSSGNTSGGENSSGSTRYRTDEEAATPLASQDRIDEKEKDDREGIEEVNRVL